MLDANFVFNQKENYLSVTRLGTDFVEEMRVGVYCVRTSFDNTVIKLLLERIAILTVTPLY